MGLFDQLIGGAVGQMLGGGQSQGGMLDMAMKLVQGYPGGIQGLVNQFTQAGFGKQAQSWVGTGQNMPIAPADLMKVFGQGQLQNLGQQANLGSDQAAGGLAAILPEIINQLTPKGQVTQGSEFETLLGALRGRL
ncbi:MAG: YidB family protein [Burkholderiales bacterium]